MEKLISTLVAVCMCFAVSGINVNAADFVQSSEKISAARELSVDVDSIAKVEKIKLNQSEVDEIASADYYNYTGEKIQSLPVNVSVEKITLSKNYDDVPAHTAYILAASTVKTSTNSGTSNNVTMKGTIKWYDVTGTNNILDSVSGSRSGSYNSNKGNYNYGRDYNQAYYDYSWTGSSFSNSEHSGLTGYSFSMRMTSYNNSGKKVTLGVNTSIFD